MAISPNEQDRNKAAYRENPLDGGTDRRVSDTEAYTKLDAIANALGGATTTTRYTYNVVTTTAGVEYSQVLPSNVKSFTIKTRTNGVLKLSTVATESGTNYVTIKGNAVYSEDKFYTSLTLYFQSDKDGETVEIIAHT